MSQVLVGRYSAPRGGHATGHLRDALVRSLEEGRHRWWARLGEPETIAWHDPAARAWWDGLSGPERGRWLTGQLWNCTDVLPGHVCDELDLPLGSSYAQGARRLRADLA